MASGAHVKHSASCACTSGVINIWHGIQVVKKHCQLSTLRSSSQIAAALQDGGIMQGHYLQFTILNHVQHVLGSVQVRVRYM